MTEELKLWNDTKEMLGEHNVRLGSHWSFNFRNDPKRLGFVLSRYKFAAKMGANARTILELGCSEGIGAPILAEKADHYFGVDLDGGSIEDAKRNLQGKYHFLYDDFMGKSYGLFDLVVSLDVVEHIYQEHEDTYFATAAGNLSENGVCVIGTPNITAAAYASEASNLGHVNLYSQERLHDVMSRYFHIVMPFGMNDEVMHTGFSSMAHYIFCVGCFKK